MNRNSSWAAGKVLAAAILTLTLTLMLVPGAQATGRKMIYQFKGGADGSMPQEGAVLDSAGNLYGTTFYGGGSGCGGQGCGTVFKLSPNPDGSWSESVLYAFQDNNGGPAATLIFDGAGNLYGTTYGVQWAWGSVFKLAPNPDGSWAESAVWIPRTNDDGYGFNASLTLDKAGNLYGTTEWGGGGPPYSGGVVFRLVPNPDGSWTYSKLHAFQGNPDGRLPIDNGVVFDEAGNLYGQTAYGGNIDAGIVYKLSPNPDGSWTETVLHSFAAGTDGENPDSTLIFGPDAALYGTTYRGGNDGCYDPRYQDGTGCGLIFRMVPKSDGSWTEQIVHRFTGADGGNPKGSVIFDAAGSLYGTTFHAGDMSCGTELPPLGCGTVFKLARTPGGLFKMKVIAAHNHPNSHPIGALVLDKAENIYGVTQGDGVKTFGSVFEITP